MKNQLALAILLFYFSTNFAKKITTVYTANNFQDVTTGNEDMNRLNFQWLVIPKIEDQFQKNFEDVKNQVNKYIKLKNLLILDIPSEDPLIFAINDADYWYVASKRGTLFHIAAIICMFFIFWVFHLRITKGHCGGYKTIVRKPTKEARHGRIKIISISSIIFIAASIGSLYTFCYLTNLSNKHGKSLIQKNEFQIEQLSLGNPIGITTKINQINDSKYEVSNSSVNFEYFRIGLFTQNLQEEYQKSLQNAKDFISQYLMGQKYHILYNLIVITVCTILLLIAFYFIYIKRKVLYSLGITAALFLLIIFSFHTMAKNFNDWSISVELCQESLNIYDQRQVQVKPDDIHMKNILTCLSPEGKQLLRTQILSLMIAQNTVLNILKHLAYTSNNSEKDLYYKQLFSEKKFLLNGEHIIRETEQGDPNVPLIRYLDLFMEIERIIKKSEDLSTCKQQIIWTEELNDSLCRKGLKWQNISMWLLLIMIGALFILSAGVFLSENIIRGLYNEEIKYVKTNKLRYDWN